MVKQLSWKDRLQTENTAEVEAGQETSRNTQLYAVHYFLETYSGCNYLTKETSAFLEHQPDLGLSVAKAYLNVLPSNVPPDAEHLSSLLTMVARHIDGAISETMATNKTGWHSDSFLHTLLDQTRAGRDAFVIAARQYLNNYATPAERAFYETRLRTSKDPRNELCARLYFGLPGRGVGVAGIMDWSAQLGQISQELATYPEYAKAAWKEFTDAGASSNLFETTIDTATSKLKATPTGQLTNLEMLVLLFGDALPLAINLNQLQLATALGYKLPVNVSRLVTLNLNPFGIIYKAALDRQPKKS